MEIDYLKIFLPLTIAAIVWIANEWRKRGWEEYKRKEDRYQELLKSLKGFYLTTWLPDESKELKNHFIDQINLCWMYCPDDVIRKIYRFIDTVHTDKIHNEVEKEIALGELVLAIRNDLISRKVLSKTTLEPEDFRVLTST